MRHHYDCGLYVNTGVVVVTDITSRWQQWVSDEYSFFSLYCNLDLYQ